jgi:1-deoxy-D-xylulose-5-phosphate synthase
MSEFLPQINSPADLKKIEIDNLPELTNEIREFIIDVCSKNGGHLGASLGAVDFITALHYVYDAPRDIFVYDVSHQSYAHKILTGRRDRFPTIRTKDGLSGFTSRFESDYDAFGAGHACTALSAALGFAAARDLKGEDHKIIAVLGDGSLTGGMTWEGLNQIGSSGRNILVVLNDNNMSISKNVGAIAKYLTEMLSDEPYNRLKSDIWRLSGLLPKYNKLRGVIAMIEESLKGFMVPGIIFEKFGFRYFGPIDGNDVKLMVKTMNNIKTLPGPKFLHLLTVKGKGYEFAENDSVHYHGVTKFDKVTGKSLAISKSLPYTRVFGETMAHLASEDKSICAITAAMSSGTGLEKFSQEFPERFFDVGIAEQHGATFAAGLAAGGLKPFYAVYSTFLQRGFDQVMHDVALQRLPVRFCMDRAGIVGDDGPTHHGCFDISFLRPVPNLVLFAPKDGRELRDGLKFAVDYNDGPIAIRYPRQSIPEESVEMDFRPLELGSWEILREGNDLAILAVGSMVYAAWKAAEVLEKDGLSCRLVNARFIKPMDEQILSDTFARFNRILTVCENATPGGFGEGVIEWGAQNGFYEKIIKDLSIPDHFIEHGPRPVLLHNIGLDPEGIASAALELHETAKIAASARKTT